MSASQVILGIDPGLRVTGFGVIQIECNQAKYIDSGCIRTTDALDDAERLKQIDDGLITIANQYQPTMASIERIFSFFNIKSALKLGQARGVAMCAMARFGVPLFEYTAKQVKQSVVGYGAADKHQMQQMVMTLLKLNKKPAQDAADALAIALCHYHSSGVLGQLHATKTVKGRLQ